MSKKGIKISSRKAKGRNLQKYIATKISELLGIPWGKDELIRSREMGQSGTDIVLIGEAGKRFPYSIECKNQEKWDLAAYVEQAKSNQKKGTDWLLFIKRNREKPIVVMDVEVLFNLFKQIEESKYVGKEENRN